MCIVLLSTDINDCIPDPCQNGATCKDLVGSYRCDCVAGYTGSNCETSKHLGKKYMKLLWIWCGAGKMEPPS